MRSNTSGLDRVVRITVAIQMLALALSKTITGTAGVALLGIGGALLVSGVTGFCLVYKAIGWSTAHTAATAGGAPTPP